MGYIINQFNQPFIKDIDADSADSTIYMTLIKNGAAAQRQSAVDSGVSGESSSPFYDECVKILDPLEPGINYYFHGKIKRLNSDQIFYIYLVNYEDSQSKMQYIKTITIQGGDESEWVDLEFTFNPLLSSFNCILFQLQRTVEDYRTEARTPIIIYEELSKINNMISSKIGENIKLLKIGVQSHPGLMMCLNGEEIHVGKTGIYEVRNGVITVNFLSFLFVGIEKIENVNLIAGADGDTLTSFEEYLTAVSASQCIFDTPKIRNIDAFTLDYMYKED